MSGTGNWQSSQQEKRDPDATVRHRGWMTKEQAAKLAGLTGPEPASTDANGWSVGSWAGDKRLWLKQWLAVATDSAPASFLINGADLPEGVATMAEIHVVGCEVRASADAAYYNARVQNSEANAYLSVRVMTVDGSDLDSIVNSVDLFVTLAER